MELASEQAHVVAIDLPGVGESVDASTDGSKRQLAQAVHQLISIMNLTDVTLHTNPGPAWPHTAS